MKFIKKKCPKKKEEPKESICTCRGFFFFFTRVITDFKRRLNLNFNTLILKNINIRYVEKPIKSQ